MATPSGETAAAGPARRFLFRWVLGSAGLLLLLAGFAGRPAVQSSSLCASCHEMRPYSETLTASAHSRFTCVNCHSESGKPFWQGGMTALRRLYRHLAGLPATGIAPPRLQDGVCLQCHNLERAVTPGGDLLIPHQTHAGRRVACTACHAAVVHGAQQLPAKGEAAQRWGEKVDFGILGDTQPPMGLCMSCHKRRRASLECQACHSNTKMPETHLTEDFYSRHGQEAEKDLQSCNSCHRYGARDRLDQAALKNPIEYAKNNPFCGDCHGKLPPSHQQGDWRADHGKGARVEECAACHGMNQGQAGMPARTNCNNCHYTSHNAGWRVRHPVEVGRGLEGQCFQCHSSRTCGSCHLGFQ